MLLASLAPALGLNFNDDTLNLIDNGDLANGDFPSFLSECDANAACATRRGGELKVVNESGLFGNHTLRFTANANDDYTLPWFGTATKFNASQGDVFLFSTYCRTKSSTSRATLVIFNADDRAERTASRGSCTSDEWTELSVTHTVDSADTTGVKLRLDNDGGKDAVILFDGFFLTIVLPPQVHLQFFGGSSNCASTVPPSLVEHGVDVIVEGRAASHTADIAHFELGGDLTDYKPELAGYQTGTNFQAVLSAAVPIHTGGAYNFSLTLGNGDTAVVYVDGDVVLSTPCSRGGTNTYAATVELDAGVHAVRVLFVDDGWYDHVLLQYSGPDTDGSIEHVPTVAFPAPPEPSCNEDAKPGPSWLPGRATCKALIVDSMNLGSATCRWGSAPCPPLTAAAAGAEVATRFAPTCGGCEYWYLSPGGF